MNDRLIRWWPVAVFSVGLTFVGAALLSWLGWESVAAVYGLTLCVLAGVEMSTD